MHLISEAKDRQALSHGLLVRIAKALNRLWERRGRVFADRYHDHILRSSREVRNALCYVMHNAKRHCRYVSEPFDPFTSGWWFDGWRRLGLLSVGEVPGPPVRAG